MRFIWWYRYLLLWKKGDQRKENCDVPGWPVTNTLMAEDGGGSLSSTVHASASTPTITLIFAASVPSPIVASSYLFFLALPCHAFTSLHLSPSSISRLRKARSVCLCSRCRHTHSRCLSLFSLSTHTHSLSLSDLYDARFAKCVR
jgi:hypothetical protein